MKNTHKGGMSRVEMRRVFVGALLITLALVLTLFYVAPSFAAYGSGSGGSIEQGGSGGGQGSGGSGAGGGTVGGGSPGSGGDSGSGGSPGGGGSTGGGGSPGGGGEEPVVGNNLSFPTIAVDGFSITALGEPSFETVYSGPYTGLSADELALLEGGDWYSQKTEGNEWQAEYVLNEAGIEVPVYGIDWGDNIESVNPIVGNPFRLEITLYYKGEAPMDAYTMALLANPSSPDEVQGTNGKTYENDFATVVSSEPRLIVQPLGDTDPDALTWGGDEWAVNGDPLSKTTLSFGAELNVGGKYVYGASKGGWRPKQDGLYRITFYMPESDISFADAVIGNYADWIALETTEETDEDEEGAATPIVDGEKNITYIDVMVVSRRDGGKPTNPGEGEDGEGEETVTTALPTSSMSSEFDTEFVATDDGARIEVETVPEMCTPYLTDYMGEGMDNDPTQVSLLQSFLNNVLGTGLPVTGYFGSLTTDAVKEFQTMYADSILEPWVTAGYTDVLLSEGTGYVYLTTLARINTLVCTGE